ncbi:MAG TPA: C25 family cysteine peptidase, partial [Blastocatellia bacterium]|nr:C25 family cysteine peptidase [Blastocatellia bacterium]
TASTNGAMLEVALQGVTLTGHRVEVQINGTRAGEVAFNGQDEGTARLSVVQSLLKEGANIVRLVPLGGPSDVSLADYVRMTYWHTFVADSNQLRFNASPKQVVSIDGFTSAAVRVFDVTNPNAPQEMLGAIRPGKSGYSVTLSVQGSGLRTLLALTDDTAQRAANITLDQPSAWRQSNNAANLVIFTRREFMMALEPLKTLRQSQGYKVAVVDIEDVYDEFSYGNKTPQAIQDFLAYARGNWKIAPSFVILAGDASFDPKNYLGFGANDLVPTRLIDTQLMETASDDWLADLNGDGLAEMAMGRLPIRSQREAAGIVAKIVGYDRGSRSRSEGVLLVADDSLDGINFETSTAELRSIIPADQRVEQINRGGLDPATAKSLLLDAINRGQKIINYDGHGNMNGWRGGLLTVEDADGLSNVDSLSLFVMMTCLNGYFHDAQLDSLAESLLRAEKGGAVAVWASSGMTLPSDQGVMNMEMFRRLFDANGSRTLGETALQAKSKGLNKDARLTWILFGDPTTRIR